MKRRDFIALAGGAAILPLAARAQQSGPMRRVGMLMTVQESDPNTQAWIALFQHRLAELGWVEDQTVRFYRRWAAGNSDRIRANVAEIVGLRPDVILAQNTPMAAELHRQTDSIPVVFVQVSDPVGDGFVASLAQPGGSVTGFTNTMASLGGKWLELLREAVPGMKRVGCLFNRATAPGAGTYYMESLRTAAKSFGVSLVELELRNAEEIDSVIANFAAAGGDGIVTNSDSFNTVNRDRIIAAVNRHRLPTIYAQSAFTRDGALIGYGAQTDQQWLGAAGYVDRILRGEKPRDLPVQLPTKFVLALNLKTAALLGIKMPLTLQAAAEEVIE